MSLAPIRPLQILGPHADTGSVSVFVRSVTPRLIFPPPADRRRFPDLTAGEAKVLDYLDRTLEPDWEIYVQPHLNNLRPDFVLLEPVGRVLVVEVKDWTFESWQIRWHARPQAAPLPIGRSGQVELAQRNPVEQVLNYRSEIAKLYAHRNDGRPGPVDVVLVFPFAPRSAALSGLAPALEHRFRTPIPIRGADDVEDPTLDPVSVCARASHAPEAVARLREWLVEPMDIITTEPVPLTSRQHELITTRTDSGYRRIRGAAGAGKSLVVAGRAAHVSRSGKDVLVISYNHTLTSYLRKATTSFRGVASRITWLGFHEWCARVMADTGRWPRYQALWNEHSASAVLDLELPAAVADALGADDDELTPRYDAILVDEGQDFLPDWWNCLRRVLRPGGEMVLAADPAQDVFDRVRSWTETQMTGAGFTGRWTDLGASHRMPLPLIPLARTFAKQFLPEAHILLPEEPRQLRLEIDNCRLRWVQTTEKMLLDNTVAAVERTVVETLGRRPELHAPGDFVLLTDSNERGRGLVDLLAARGHELVHTFASSNQESRAAKKTFFLGGAVLRATTAHSFKGWEAPAIVVCLARGNTQQTLALLYSAITRLKAHELGSSLTVVNAEPRLERYGKTWPDATAVT